MDTAFVINLCLSSHTKEAITITSKHTSSQITFFGSDTSTSVNMILSHAGGPKDSSPLLQSLNHLSRHRDILTSNFNPKQNQAKLKVTFQLVNQTLHSLCREMP